MRVLITGGAGFIGSRLALRLARSGIEVTVLDSLREQIHGRGARFAPALRKAAECIRGDVCDRNTLAWALHDQDAVVHLAAETGTGQSMYEVEHYARTNLQGTATLQDLLVNQRPDRLRKVMVASSRAIYGEGSYSCRTHGVVYPHPRTAEAMAAGRFEPVCPTCGGDVEIAPTSEDVPFQPSSFYGLTKQVQEQTVLMFARAIGIDGLALRYQNVYGPGQSLSNPYTGLLAVFSNLARRRQSINVFEDGLESRDFVYIDDVVEATATCLAPEVRGVHALNVGSGRRTSVIDVARAVVAHFGVDVPIRVTGDFRIGDIRHNVADIARIRELTGWIPRWSFDRGLQEFLTWAAGHDACDVGFERSLAELRERGMLASAGPVTRLPAAAAPER